MNNTLSVLTSTANNTLQLLNNNKDRLLLAGGITLGVGTVVSTVRSTLNCQKIIKDHKDTQEMIALAEEIRPDYKGSQDEKDDVKRLYISTATSIAKQVVLPAALGAGSLTCFVGEHCVMRNKVTKLSETVVGLSAAYAAVDTAFKKYRKNVVDELGEEADERFRTGAKKEKIEVEETDEKGKTKKVKKEISVIDEPDISDYAKFFDCTSEQFVWKDPLHYHPDWDANIHFLNCQQSYANQLLRIKGYLFLNDVYDMLGIPKTKAGQVVGWIYDPEDETIDSRVSFGTYELRNKKVINQEGGYEYEQCILLDFNVDGVIIDKVEIGDK